MSPDTGILVPPVDEAALAKALRETLSDKHRFDRQKIRQHATDNYAYAKIASRILQTYQQVVRG